MALFMAATTFGPVLGSRNLRLHIYCGLALALLGRRNHRRPTMSIPTLHARNLRTRNSQTACTKATQRDRRRLHHGSNRARENRHRPHRHRCANSSNPHDLLRAARPLFLYPHLLRLRHLLHILPSLPNHRIGIYDFNAGEGLAFLPIGHRRRHLPMLGLDPPPGPSAQQAVGMQQRDAAAAARLPHGAVLRALTLLGGLDGAQVRPLDRAHPRRHPVRHRLPVPVHGVAELPRRRVRDLCQRHGCV